MASDSDDRPAPSSIAAEPAEILREYGPFPEPPHVRGVSYDGARVWFASDNRLHAIDPSSGDMQRTIDVPADAGTAFDGRHLFQIGDGRIHRIDPQTGAVLSSIPAPVRDGNSGL